MATQILQRALNRYLRTVSIAKKGYEQEKYRVGLIARSFLGEIPVKDVTSVDIATYRDNRLAEVNTRTKKPTAPATVRLEMSLLSNFFDIARIEWGIVKENPVANVRKPKPAPGRDRRLTPREDRIILRFAYNFSNRELYPIIVLALETAMRQGEILKLKWENINLRLRIAHLPETKNGSKRDVPLSLKAVQVLKSMSPQLEGDVFSYTSNGLKSTWRYVIQLLGIQDLHFHDLRHEATSRLFELGTLEMMEIASITGHKSLQMLKRYTHLRAELLVKKLDGNKNRGRQEIMKNLVPYPALLHYQGDNHQLRILDFDDLILMGNSEQAVVESAQDALLRRIMLLMRESVPIPRPGQYLDMVNEQEVMMIDPLAA